MLNVIDLWKTYLQNPEINDEVREWINIYEKRLESKKNLSEIGERFFDFSSSILNLPYPFSQVLEYEASPHWGAIMQDYRKLLGALAPIKIGIFHLPKTSPICNPPQYAPQPRMTRQAPVRIGEWRNLPFQKL